MTQRDDSSGDKRLPAAAQARGRHGRLRAFRSTDPETEMRGHMARLSVFLSTPGQIARALRDARKAARGGARHYDPARHAALLRLARRAATLEAATRDGAAPCGADHPRKV